MRVLLDEDLPRKLKRELAGHEVATVREMRWNGIKNGELLRLASARFDILLTGDRHMQHQQHLPVVGIAIVVLAVRANTKETIRPLVPDILTAFAGDLLPGTVTVVGHWRVR